MIVSGIAASLGVVLGCRLGMRLRVRREPKSLIPKASGGGIGTPGSQEPLQLGKEKLFAINKLHDEVLSGMSANFQLTRNTR
jgi:hypothetical protein